MLHQVHLLSKPIRFSSFAEGMGGPLRVPGGFVGHAAEIRQPLPSLSVKHQIKLIGMSMAAPKRAVAERDSGGLFLCGEIARCLPQHRDGGGGKERAALLVSATIG